MTLKKLVLTDFRNYAQLAWQPTARVSVFVGENGAGKTNLLEALSLLSPGRGLRGASLAQMARFGASRWGIYAELTEGQAVREVGVGYDETAPARRQLRLDGQPTRAQIELAGIYPVVWLTPQMDRLFSESASGRRRFFDRLIFTNNAPHARQLAAHDAAVQQRNRLLFERPHEASWISGIEDSIARHAVAVTAARLAFVDAINDFRAYDPVFPLPQLTLQCEIGALLAEKPALKVEDIMRERLALRRKSDRETRVTSLGAHRADYLIKDRKTGRAAQYSSSGQQKTLLTGIVLSYAREVGRQHGVPPTLLLDEPMVHLDATHRDALMRAITDMAAPAFLTGTDIDAFTSLGEDASRIRVRDGALTLL